MPVKKTSKKVPVKTKVRATPSTIQMKEIFDLLKPLLKVYEPPFHAQVDVGSRYELWSEKEVVIEGRKRKGFFFASLIIQSNYVGFYFMPVYLESELKKIFGQELLATLKGKSCFHITRADTTIIQQIKKALKKGHSLYKERGYF